jgi:hypothetical protein
VSARGAREPAGEIGKERRGDPRLRLARLSDEDLFRRRICDLGLQIEGTPLEERIARVYHELERRQIRFRPHFWLGEEWFTPDGVPGVAIPFYLAHPRLMQLERKEMLEVEGGSEDWCMKILRHEVGHAIDNAYRLRRMRRWREVFGPASKPYPDYYQPRPYSRSFVLHLDMWYGQSHPVEDFAETFAVWLKPNTDWRVRYRGWPALKKLEFVDRLMRDVRTQRPKVFSRARIESAATLRMTLGEYYEKKRTKHGVDYPNFYDNDLRRLFTDSPNAAGPPAASFLRRIRPQLRKVIARWTGQYQYTIDQVFTDMIERSRELNLRLDRSQEEVERDALILVTVQTMNYLHGGGHRVFL